jgi:hypothetical protein
MGNTDRWRAQSYLAASTANSELYFGRTFRGGIRFRTLCAECNNGLGAKEDKALISFCERVKKIIESPILRSPMSRVPAKPNLIYRGLLGHLVAANDSGVPSAFDTDARELFFRRRDLRSATYSLFYWIYVDDALFLMRNAYHTVWHPRVEVRPIQIAKMYPLAFMFVQEPWFLGLPNMRSFLRANDEQEYDVPIWIYRRDTSPVWPVVAEQQNIILLAGNSFGLVGNRA